jgi:hypothetical protein
MKSNVTARGRIAALPAVAVLALIGALAVGSTQTTADAATARSAPPVHAGHSPMAHLRALTPAQVVLHDQMRRLWEDHVTWTRMAIVTFADGSAGFSASATRLLQNQVDIGDAIKPFYGKAAGDRLTALLHDHITIAVEVLQAAKAGDSTAFAEADARWYANANDIADFLAAANPRFWPRSMMRADMKTHLDQTLAEAAHELGSDYSASVADYEAVHAHILEMADLLTNGIIGQFPGKVH